MTQGQYKMMFWASLVMLILSSLLTVQAEIPASLIICSAIYMVGGDISKRLQDLKK